MLVLVYTVTLTRYVYTYTASFSLFRLSLRWRMLVANANTYSPLAFEHPRSSQCSWQLGSHPSGTRRLSYNPTQIENYLNRLTLHLHYFNFTPIDLPPFPFHPAIITEYRWFACFRQSGRQPEVWRKPRGKPRYSSIITIAFPRRW